MKNLNLILMGLILSIGLSFTSCKKDEVIKPNPLPIPPVNTNANPNAGYGNNAGIPAGMPFLLPNQIRITDLIRGGQGKESSIMKKSAEGPYPSDIIPKEWTSYGTGTYVRLYIKFYNESNFDINFTLPAGLVFYDTTITDTTEGIYQNGLCLQPVSISVAAKSYSYALVNAYCLNANKMSSSYNAVFRMSGVTFHPELRKMVDILKNKQLVSGQQSQMQSLIWKITDSNGVLSESDLTYLNSLP